MHFEERSANVVYIAHDIDHSLELIGTCIVNQDRNVNANVLPDVQQAADFILRAKGAEVALVETTLIEILYGVLRYM